jgi:Ca2+-binding RTX toxin-like protein
MSTYQVFFDAPQFTFSEIDFGSPMGEFRTVVVYLDQETVFNLSGITVTGATPGSLLDVIGDDDAETITGSSGPDRLYGFGGADTLRGGDGNDTLYGGLENDNLDGGPGSDTMRGDEGDDIYTVAQVGDTVTESADEGFDTVYAYVDFALDDNTEVLVLRGAATSGTGGAGFNRIYGSIAADTLSGMGDDDVLYGGEGGDALIGGAGNDKLDGGPGNDTMTGGTEDDIYIVAQTADTVVELAMEGTDSVYSYVDYTLSANVENLILRGSAHMATGNAEANSIAGTSGNDTLTGLAGNDKLFGKSGNDILSGGNDADRLYGDRGQDTMTGGTGQDQFIFRETADTSNQIAFADLITDYSKAEFDKIVLTEIDADETNGAGTNEAFSFIGTDPFTAPGQVRYEQVGGDTHVFGNTDADLFPEFAIVLTGTITFVSGDFFL